MEKDNITREFKKLYQRARSRPDFHKKYLCEYLDYYWDQREKSLMDSEGIWVALREGRSLVDGAEAMRDRDNLQKEEK